jgi:pimeloyl-ACP methyl ester carboxylesterase
VTSDDALERGRGSFERRAWGDAYVQLSAADLRTPLELDDLERLAAAAYLSGRDPESEALRVQPDELRNVATPTLLVWGDHDPVGSVEVAEATRDLIPNARLEVLPAGHGPWLGDPAKMAELVSDFVR